MQYRNGCKGDRLSALGYGCLRMTRRGGKIDLAKMERELMAAIRGGVNYVDTAYSYSGSEEALGKILEKNHARDKVFIATKLPTFLVRSEGMIERMFREELKRLRTDHIDYYLMHMLNDIGAWEKLSAMHIEEWLKEKLDSGQIRHVGFSYHGSEGEFLRVLDAYPWDFCQIQYNYMDEHSQAGRAGLRAAAARGIPVIIMEPLRGGRLVELLPMKAREMIRSHESGRSAAEWGLRWLWDQPEVTTVLSGMNSVEMVEENLRIAEASLPGCMDPAEHDFICKLRHAVDADMKVNCTGCGYCMPCPRHVDIPGVFRCYNQIAAEGRRSAGKDYLRSTIMRHETSSASQCIGCGACERKCPQGLAIRKELKDAAEALETPYYRIAKKVVGALRIYG